MAITITEKKKCTGCAVCSNVCPKNCIMMVEDEMGFHYPIVDGEKCIGCDLCEKCCPVLNQTRPQNYDPPMVYAARTKDFELRFHSTSGGVFSELANLIIEQGGVACGARYDKNNLVEHCLVKSVSDLDKIRQSKYAQSFIGEVYKEIKKELHDGKMVAFCGTPCQVSGLYKFLGREYENLVTFDFICRGVNSPKAYRYWLKEVEEENGSRVTRVWFKYKQNGWKKSPRCTRVDFSNGQFKVYSDNENSFMSGYLGPNLYIRPSCGDCAFKGTPRVGDITLADFWGLDSKLEDDGGTSLVMLNSKKGENLFEQLNERIEYELHEFSEIYAGNVCANGSVKINPKSEIFLKKLGTKPFSKLVTQYSKPDFWLRVKRKIKNFIE